MYLPPLHKKDGPHPMRIRQSKRQLYAGGIVAVMAGIAAAIYALGKAQNRERHAQLELAARRSPGQRVVIIGAGTGGCALAAALCNTPHYIHVTVIEQRRRYTFHGLVPLAHVGHRSYDLNTSGGIDFLSSPTTWNLTRDAHLVEGTVLKVMPDAQKVLVRVHQSVTSAPCGGPGPSPARGEEGGQAPKGVTGGYGSWWRRLMNSRRPSRADFDGDPTLASSGFMEYPYDVLVVATGAQRTLGPLDRFLQHSDLDTFQVAVNPGITRDALSHLYKGNLLHIKVPPASFVAQMEEIRRKLLPPPTMLCEADLQGVSCAAAGKRGGIFSLLFAADHATGVGTAGELGGSPRQLAGAWCDGSGQAAVLRSPYMHCAARQHDGTFVSTTNLIWKYLHYFSKLSLCRLYAVTADAEPIGPAPPALNRVIRSHWTELQGRSYRRRASAASPAQADAKDNSHRAEDLHFHFLSHTYPTHIDLHAKEVTLYNYLHNALVSLPFQFMLLDLPLRAPAFVRESGLHRSDYAREHRPPFLSTEWAQSALDPSARQTATTVPALTGCFCAEEGFLDVHPDTLQHRRYDNIFGIGDVAGLPTVKGYGSTLAQVPVVAFNVQQVLHSQRSIGLPGKTLSGARVRGGGGEPPDGPMPLPLPQYAKAVYNGYSSFHICMSTWRAMWPEMAWDPRRMAEARRDPRGAAALVIDPPLVECNHHMWDNLAWRGVRGVMNALAYQTGLYEILFFFVFTRGAWYPPGWFAVPAFSPDDGSLVETRKGRGWL